MSDDLIKRLEDGPSREIDAAIATAIEFGDACACTGACMPHHSNYQGACVCVPHYTSSIDAALTLVSHWAIIAQRHLLARVMQRIHDGNLDPAKHMARLICIEALPDLRAREDKTP